VNKAWVNGTGAMRIDSDKDFQGNKLKEPVPLNIYWNDRMLFDGSHKWATFFGGVQADQANARLACDNLYVQLDQPMSLREGKKKDGPPPKVDQLVCDSQGGKVRMENTVFEGGSLVKYDRLEAVEVKVDNADGTILAPGPGLVRNFQPAPANGPGSPGSRGPLGRPTNRGAGAFPSGKSDEPETKLTWVRYQGRMYANNKTHTATFLQGVEVFHLPTDDPNLEPNMSKLPEGALYLRSEHLTVYRREDEAGTNQEMKARGNVVVRGNGFWARADEVDFNEAKDQVILRGLSGNLVRLFQLDPATGKEQETTAGEVIYSRKTGKFNMIGGRGVRVGR
jgi:lipopolysaccharide export system protein LptA